MPADDGGYFYQARLSWWTATQQLVLQLYTGTQIGKKTPIARCRVGSYCVARLP